MRRERDFSGSGVLMGLKESIVLECELVSEKGEPELPMMRLF